MNERLACEFALIRFVPDVVKGEFTNIGVLLREAGQHSQAVVRFTHDWARVRCMDRDADVDMLESLEAEMNARLAESEPADTKPMLQVLQDTLSNGLQITEMRGTLAETFDAELEQLLHMYVETRRLPAERRRLRGRAALLASMRAEFERAGVWTLMRKRISAAQYTQPGDPLKIDCGYRNGKVRMFHAVSLENDAEAAKGLAYSAAALGAGVARDMQTELELTAVVEPVDDVADEEQYGFAVSAMERASIRVLSVKELAAVADVARRELRV